MRSFGSTTLQLNPAVIGCDVAEFEDAVEQGATRPRPGSIAGRSSTASA
jgi:hypothetical protein